MNTIARLLLPLALLALAACGGGAGAEGTWKLDSDALLADNQEAMNPTGGDIPAEMLEMMKTMFSQMDATLELKGDGTMSGTMTMPNPMGGDPMSNDMTGTWTLDGDKISMTSKDGENGVEETMTGTMADGKITVVQSDNGQELKMTFVRQ